MSARTKKSHLLCYVRSAETRSVKRNALKIEASGFKRATQIVVALINYPNKQQDFSAFITFSSQGSSCPSPAYLLISISAFLAGKFLSHVAAHLTRECWVPNFRHFITIPPFHPYLPLFVTIRHYSRLFAIRGCSLFTICYSRLFAIRYSGFPDTRLTCNGVPLYFNNSTAFYCF